MVVEGAARGWAGKVGLKGLETILHDADGEAGPDGTADVWVLPAARLPHWSAAGRIQPLPERLTARRGPLEWEGILPAYRIHLLRWEERAYAVPLVGDSPLCFYRKDLFADPRHQAGYLSRTGLSLKAPESWEEFAALAEYFRDDRTAGKSAPSLPPLPESSAGLDRLFYTVAASIARRRVPAAVQAVEFRDADLFSFHFDLDTGRPRLREEGFVHALKLLGRLQACRPSSAAAEPWRAFLDGDAVLCLGDARLLGEFQGHDSPVRDRVGVCPVPGSRIRFNPNTRMMETMEAGQVNRVPYLGAGAFVLAVPRSSGQSEAAFDLLAELAGRRVSQQIVLEPKWGGGATRAAHLDENWDGWRLEAPGVKEAESGQALVAREAIRATLQPNLRNPLLCLRIPREHAFRAALTERLRAALNGGNGGTDEAAGAVLADIVSRWNELIEPDAEAHRQAYRASLGLN